MDVNSALSSLQIAITCAKGVSAAFTKIKEVNKQLDSIEFKNSLLELQENLVNVKGELMDLIQENQELRRQLQLRNELQFDNDSKAYWRITSQGKDGPFCSICYGAESILIPLHPKGEASWHCSKCKGHFQTEKNRQEQLRKCLSPRSY